MVGGARLGGHGVGHHGARQGHGNNYVTVAAATDPTARPVTGLLVSDVDSTFLTQEVI